MAVVAYNDASGGGQIKTPSVTVSNSASDNSAAWNTLQTAINSGQYTADQVKQMKAQQNELHAANLQINSDKTYDSATGTYTTRTSTPTNAAQMQQELEAANQVSQNAAKTKSTNTDIATNTNVATNTNIATNTDAATNTNIATNTDAATNTNIATPTSATLKERSDLPYGAFPITPEKTTNDYEELKQKAAQLESQIGIADSANTTPGVPTTVSDMANQINVSITNKINANNAEIKELQNNIDSGKYKMIYQAQEAKNRIAELEKQNQSLSSNYIDLATSSSTASVTPYGAEDVNTLLNKLNAVDFREPDQPTLTDKLSVLDYTPATTIVGGKEPTGGTELTTGTEPKLPVDNTGKADTGDEAVNAAADGDINPTDLTTEQQIELTNRILNATYGTETRNVYNNLLPEWKKAMEDYLTAQTAEAKSKAEAEIDYATQKAVRELQSQLEDSRISLDQEKAAAAYSAKQAADNIALTNAANGNRGGIGEKLYSTQQAQYDTQLTNIKLEELALINDTQRQITELEAQGEYDKAISAYELAIAQLENMMNLETEYMNQKASLATTIDSLDAQQEETNYNRALARLQMGMFSAEDAKTLGISDAQAQQYADYINQMYALDAETAKAELAATQAQTNYYNAQASGTTDTESAEADYSKYSGLTVSEVNTLASNVQGAGEPVYDESGNVVDYLSYTVDGLPTVDMTTEGYYIQPVNRKLYWDESANTFTTTKPITSAQVQEQEAKATSEASWLDSYKKTTGDTSVATASEAKAKLDAITEEYKNAWSEANTKYQTLSKQASAMEGYASQALLNQVEAARKEQVRLHDEYVTYQNLLKSYNSTVSK